LERRVVDFPVRPPDFLGNLCGLRAQAVSHCRVNRSPAGDGIGHGLYVVLHASAHCAASSRFIIRADWHKPLRYSVVNPACPQRWRTLNLPFEPLHPPKRNAKRSDFPDLAFSADDIADVPEVEDE
jgi:hypothetical protein